MEGSLTNCVDASTAQPRTALHDEIQHVLAGPALKQRHFLNVIKYLGKELQIPIVAVGTRDAFNAVQTNPFSTLKATAAGFTSR